MSFLNLNSTIFKKSIAFTLAEVVIVIGIIGIIAEVTIPILVSNFQKQQTVTALKKTYTSIAQAVKTSESENGPIAMWDWGVANDTVSIRKSFDTYWAPYLRISKYCTSYQDCGYNSQNFTFLNGSTNTLYIVLPTLRTTTILSDGTLLIVIAFSGSGTDYRVIYTDINGAQKPNITGKDVFIFILDPNMGIVPYGYEQPDATIKNSCSKDGTGSYCAAKIIRDGWQIKDDYPW